MKILQSTLRTANKSVKNQILFFLRTQNLVGISLILYFWRIVAQFLIACFSFVLSGDVLGVAKNEACERTAFSLNSQRSL